MMEESKSPWIWKAALVFLPAGLALSAGIALWWKINVEDERGMASVTYQASEFSPANLRDTAGKLEDRVGQPGFDTEEGKTALRQTAALVQGELGLNNLGYKVSEEEAVRRSGRIWKNFRVKAGEGPDGNAVVIWTNYRTEPTGTAALLSLAEWLRGRSFLRPVIVAFTVEGPPQIESSRMVEVRALGRGSAGLGLENNDSLIVPTAAVGEPDPNWKNTADWDDYESQVRELCEQVAEWAR